MKLRTISGPIPSTNDKSVTDSTTMSDVAGWFGVCAHFSSGLETWSQDSAAETSNDGDQDASDAVRWSASYVPKCAVKRTSANDELCLAA